MTSLPIEHLHLNMKLHLMYHKDFVRNSAFLQMLTNVKTIDLRNVMEPKFLQRQFFHAIANRGSVEIISLRYLQSMQLNFGTWRQFNITDVFPAYFNQSVRYLDLSRNDIESISGNFIVKFPKLKYLDVSYNKLTIANEAFTSSISLLLFHPHEQ